MNKLFTTAITSLVVCCTALASGLYLVSGGDFRQPILKYTIDTTSNSQTVNVSPYKYQNVNKGSISTYPTIRVSRGNDIQAVNNTWMTYTYPAIGTHTVKVYNNLPSIPLRIEFGYYISSENTSIKELHINGCLVNARYLTGVTNITFRGYDTIEGSAFQGYSSLQNISFLDDSLKTIGKYSFSFTSLQSFTIPDSVTTIYTGAFTHSTYLNSITLPNKDINFCTNDVAFILKSSNANFTSVFRMTNIRNVHFKGSISQWRANSIYNYLFGSAAETANADGSYTLAYSDYAKALQYQIDNWQTIGYTSEPQTDTFASNSRNGLINLWVQE